MPWSKILIEWQGTSDDSALLLHRYNSEIGADSPGAIIHDPQPESAAGRWLGKRQAIVFNRKIQRVFRAGENNRNARCLPVLNRITHGFLSYFVELSRCILRQFRNVAPYRDCAGNRERAFDIGGKFFEHARQFISARVERSEFASEIVGVVNNFLDQ